MSKPPESGGKVSFEQALAELEQVVHQLEEGKLGLNESLAQYEHGVRRLKECYALLQRAERRIELLEQVDAAGEPVTRPFDDEATIERQARDTQPNRALASPEPDEPRQPETVKPKPSRPRPAKPRQSDTEPRDLF